MNLPLRLLYLLLALVLGGCMKLREGLTALASPISHIGVTSRVEPTAARLERLKAPVGFRVEPWATGLGAPRMMTVAPDGTVLVTRPKQGDVLALRDTDGDGKADERRVAASGLPTVHGITLHEGKVYLATDERIWMAALQPDGLLGKPEVLVQGLPSTGRHPKHSLAVGPGGQLFAHVGSSCDACEEEDPLRSTLLRFNLDGTGRDIYARGLRNTLGFDWHPTTHQLWGMDMGSDHRGDNLPPEELNRIEQGKHYGWPYAYGAREVDMLVKPPPGGRTKQEFVETTEPSVLGYQAHSSPIGFIFYRGTQFPEEYRGDAFVAMHGSWNRKPPSGYSVVRVRFDERGEPLGFEHFVTGWLLPDGESHFGRPAGLAEARDGALLVSDDSNGLIYRVSYRGEDIGSEDSASHPLAPRT